MKTVELSKSKKVRVSFENIPCLNMVGYKVKPTKIEANADNLKTERVVVIELMLPFNASYYGLLGAKYIPQLDSNTLDIEVRYVDESQGNFEDSISYNKKTVFVGLTKQYADMVLDTAISLLKSDVDTPSGKIVFDVAACCDVGSSKLVFSIITKIVLYLMFSKDFPVNVSEVGNICETCLLERTIVK